MRRSAAISAALVATAGAACAACGSKAHPPEPGGWLAACEDGLARAAHEPSWKRGRTIVEACRPCGVPWEPILRSPPPAPSTFIAVVDACQLDCPKQARADLYAAISSLEPDAPPRAAWQAFDKACPAAISPAGADGRYASGAWFALDQIARRLAAAHRPAPADLELALPLVSQVGTGFELPAGGTDGLDTPHELIITLTALTIYATEPPRARLTATGLVPTQPLLGAWPGQDARYLPRPDHYAIAAPHELPVSRLHDAIAAYGPPDAIVTAVPGGAALFGDEPAAIRVPHPLPAGWPPPDGTVGDAVRALESASTRGSP